MSEWITLITFSYSHEAISAKALLDSFDIPCFLKDEYTVQQQPLWSQAIGGVKLQVNPSDAEKAALLLEENGYHVTKLKTTEVATHSISNPNQTVFKTIQHIFFTSIMGFVFFALLVTILAFVIILVVIYFQK